MTGNSVIYLAAHPLIDIDGGAVKLRNIDNNTGYHSLEQGTLHWNHGYQGSIQFLVTGAYAYGDAYVGDDGLQYYHSPIRGRNVSDGEDVDALPRSMPLISNAMFYFSENSATSGVYSAAMDLSQGTGLHLHNSLIGTHGRDFGRGRIIDFCLKTDASVDALIGTELRINQLAVACKSMASSNSANNALAAAFTETLVGNPVPAASAYSDAGTIANPSQANADIYRFDWVRGTGGTRYNDYFDEGTILEQRANWSYPASAVMDLGAANAVYDAQLDISFIKETNYFGPLDYFSLLEAGATIKDQ